jgi:hypothetical protein
MKDPNQRVQRFSSTWWLQCMHTLFWVTMITILVWIYADVKYTDEIELTAKLELTTGESQKILLSQREHSITFTLTGAQAALERFKSSLAQQDSVLTLDISQNFTPGEEVTTSTQELLEKAVKLQKLGITIKNVQPPYIAIHLDSVITQENIVVKLDYHGADLVSPPAPQKANILVSQSNWDKILAALGDAPPVLKTELVDLKEHPKGVQEITEMIFPMIESIGVSKIEPEEATFQVNIISSTQTKTIPVRVQVLVPPAWEEGEDSTWKEYELVRSSSATSNWEPELKISGLQKDLLPENIYAFIRLTEDDKQPTDSWLPRDVIVTFPPGKNIELVGPAPKVNFKLQKRISKPIQP